MKKFLFLFLISFIFFNGVALDLEQCEELKDYFREIEIYDSIIYLIPNGGYSAAVTFCKKNPVSDEECNLIPICFKE